MGNAFFQKGKYDDAAINYRKAIQKDSSNGEAYFRLGRTALKQGNGRETYINLTRAEQLLPGREDVKVELADFALAAYLLDPAHPQKLYDDVNRISRDLLAKNPSSFDGLRFAGSIALSDRKYREAADDLEKANSVKAMDPNVVGAWVDALFQLNQNDRAEKLASDLINQHKDFGPIYDVLYGRYMAGNRVADAEKILKTEVANNPGNRYDVLQLARHYLALQKTAEWNAVLNKMLGDSKHYPDAQADVGDSYAALKNWDEASKQYNEGLRAHPEKKSMYQKKMVNLLIAQDKLFDALALLDQIVQQDPKDDTSRAMRADLLINTGNTGRLDTAISDLESLAKQRSHDEGLAYTLGRAYMAKGDLNAARSQFLEALKRDGRAIPPRVFLAAIAQRQGNSAETFRLANDILAIDPRNPAGRLWHAIGLTGMGNYDQADQEFARLQQDFPNSEDVLLRVGLLRVAEKRYKDADAIFGRIHPAKTDDVRAQAGIAFVAAQGQFDGAISSLQHDLQQSPGSTQLHSVLASLAMIGAKPDIAIQENQWLLRNNPENVNAYLGLAEAYRQKGDAAAAVSAAQRAATLAPQDLKVLESTAYLTTLSGRPADAVIEYRRLLAIDPNEPTNLNNLAYLLAEEGKDLDEALSLASKATQKAPDNAGFRDTLAWIYVKKGRNDRAVPLLSNLVDKYPNHASLHYHLAMALLQQGDKYRANAELRTALTKGPTRGIEDKIKQAMSRN